MEARRWGRSRPFNYTKKNKKTSTKKVKQHEENKERKNIFQRMETQKNNKTESPEGLCPAQGPNSPEEDSKTCRAVFAMLGVAALTFSGYKLYRCRTNSASKGSGVNKTAAAQAAAANTAAARAAALSEVFACNKLVTSLDWDVGQHKSKWDVTLRYTIVYGMEPITKIINDVHIMNDFDTLGYRYMQAANAAAKCANAYANEPDSFAAVESAARVATYAASASTASAEAFVCAHATRAFKACAVAIFHGFDGIGAENVNTRKSKPLEDALNVAAVWLNGSILEASEAFDAAARAAAGAFPETRGLH